MAQNPLRHQKLIKVKKKNRIINNKTSKHLKIGRVVIMALPHQNHKTYFTIDKGIAVLVFPQQIPNFNNENSELFRTGLKYLFDNFLSTFLVAGDFD